MKEKDIKNKNRKKMARAHLFISGRVQGVAFRYYTRDIAQSLDISGWIKNCWNGKVEIVMEGEEKRLKELIDWCYRGPRRAIVEKIDIVWEEYRGEFGAFNIKMW